MYAPLTWVLKAHLSLGSSAGSSVPRRVFAPPFSPSWMKSLEVAWRLGCEQPPTADASELLGVRCSTHVIESWFLAQSWSRLDRHRPKHRLKTNFLHIVHESNFSRGKILKFLQQNPDQKQHKWNKNMSGKKSDKSDAAGEGEKQKKHSNGLGNSKNLSEQLNNNHLHLFLTVSF